MVTVIEVIVVTILVALSVWYICASVHVGKERRKEIVQKQNFRRAMIDMAKLSPECGVSMDERDIYHISYEDVGL